jgi:hypothetical protein
MVQQFLPLVSEDTQPVNNGLAIKASVRTKSPQRLHHCQVGLHTQDNLTTDDGAGFPRSGELAKPA